MVVRKREIPEQLFQVINYQPIDLQFILRWLPFRRIKRGINISTAQGGEGAAAGGECGEFAVVLEKLVAWKSCQANIPCVS